MLPDSIQLKETDETQTHHSHEEVHVNGDIIPLSKHRKLKWKLDLFILPLISIVYFFASMGRADLGNAKVAGLTDDIHISPQGYSNAATALIVGYIIFQLPGTLLLKQIGPARQFAGAMIIWGALTAASVSIQNTTQLLVLRFFIGVAEAFVQGGVFYLSFWYQYSELATRGAIFFSMSTLAGAFNGLIAYGITKDLDGVNGWRAWRWIFLIEGILPCAFAFLVLFLLPASPEAVRFGFSPEEKAMIVRRARNAHNTSEAKLQVKKMPLIFLSLHFWLLLAIACCGHFCVGSMANFLPAIIESFGYSEVNTQMFTVIVYACACLGILFWARVSDRTNARGLTFALSTCGGIAGYAMLVAVQNEHARFAATCLVAFSIYPNIVLQLAWSAMSFVGYTRRGSAIAFMNVFSQLLAICGTQAYNDPPLYRKGNAAALGLCCCNLVLCLVLRWYFASLNKKKEMRQHTDEANRQRQESWEEIGEYHPDFYYTT